MRKLVLLLLLTIVMAGCEQEKDIIEPNIENSSIVVNEVEAGVKLGLPKQDDTRKVRWIYLTPPISSTEVNVMYADRNPDKVSQILSWIEFAEPVDGKGIISPLNDRSKVLGIAYEDGVSQEIRPAWQCPSTHQEDKDGNIIYTPCQTVQDTVWIAEGDSEGRIARSKLLFDFIDTGYKEWMPDVTPYDLPDTIRLNKRFQIKGHGSMMEKVYITLSKENNVVWKSDESAVDHGEFEITGVVDSKNYSSGEYMLKIVGVPFPEFPNTQGSILTFINVTK
ncbi:hypothetical protein [Cohnella abietis]|uniref:Uncharacterized protein n=1 Tax=Cohnella abietis TaxID=2507935 RepID=A0A3T1D6M7_9BACL|nr:hypothetical protein [Cohnella abietis]BBI33736.1 hypothetical protein KCTCHS21_31350 [Cohnella abietis]